LKPRVSPIFGLGIFELFILVVIGLIAFIGFKKGGFFLREEKVRLKQLLIAYSFWIGSVFIVNQFWQIEQKSRIPVLINFRKT